MSEKCWETSTGRGQLLEEIHHLRLMVADGVRAKAIPYPSKADPHLIAVVSRALLEPKRT